MRLYMDINIHIIIGMRKNTTASAASAKHFPVSWYRNENTLGIIHGYADGIIAWTSNVNQLFLVGVVSTNEDIGHEYIFYPYLRNK